MNVSSARAFNGSAVSLFFLLCARRCPLGNATTIDSFSNGSMASPSTPAIGVRIKTHKLNRLNGSPSMLAHSRAGASDRGSCHADVADHGSGAVPPLRFLRPHGDDANVQ